MVGFIKVWPLLLSLFLFGACVPQSKQTECGSNEAFNAQLRSCVPIVQGPSAFINISSFSPLYTSTRYKNDTSFVTFTIAVSNPYNQTYTIEWDHSFNGLNNTVAGNVTTFSVIPSLYSANIGSNVFSAKILDANGVVVDSHNFELVIQETPRPNINTGSLFPADYNPILFPDNTGQRFSFTGRNNGAVGIGSFRVFWTLSRNGVGLSGYNETDTFTNTTTNGTNVFYYGTDTVPRFDPSTLGVGSYVLRTRMENITNGEVVAEHQWNITVKQPEFGFVQTAGNPLPSQDTIAFFGVPYGTYPFANSVATTSRFCVTLSDPDGSYTNGSAADPGNLDLVVRFYKDGAGSPIFEGRTDGSAVPVKSEVCFDEASAGERANLVFTDGSPTVAHYRSLVARVFDEQTGREICGTDMPTCPVTYPVKWNILVKPVDTGVIGTFQNAQAGDNIAYSTTGASTRNATVTQNQVVRIRFNPTDGIAGYEGYDMTNPANAVHFKYSVVVKHLGVTIDTFNCKDFPDPFPFTTSPTQTCSFTWPAFDPSTGAHLPPGAYVATLVVEDDGSPVPGSIGTTSTALTINATVSEPVNAPTFVASYLDTSDAVLGSPVPEGTPFKFRLAVTEAEHDRYTARVEYCGTSMACATPTLVNSDTRVWGDALYSVNNAITFTVPEDVLGSALTGTIYFRIRITDSPVDATKSSFTEQTIPMSVSNFNFLPGFTAAAVTPATGATYEVFSGNQFTARLNTAITDASVATSERTSTYQWWIGTANDLNDPAVWTAIEGATTDILRWTPGPELTATRFIAVCFSDGFPRTSANSANAPDLDGDPNQLCQSLFTITPRSSALAMSTPTAPNGEVAIHHVPAEEIAYMAYADASQIYVEKVEYNADGTMVKPMRVVSFNALTSGTALTVKNLSLAASDTSLYVSYLADNNTAPNAFRAHVRRINISSAASQGGTKSNAAFAGSVGSSRKFDFNYAGYSVITNCSSGTNCQWNNVAKTMTFDGTALNTTDTITIRQVINAVNVDTVLAVTLSPYTTGTVCGNCSANEQAESFAAAINVSASTGIQGLTAFNSASPVATLFGMETTAASIYTSVEAMTAMGKILYNPDNNLWYLPVANADLAGNQNRIQILRGPDADVSTASMQFNVLSTLDFVSSIDNAWSSDAPLQLYLGYIKISGSNGLVTKLQRTGDAFDAVTGGPRSIISASAAVSSLQLSGPIGTANPNVFVSAKDSGDKWWVTRLPANLTSQSSFNVSTIGADAADTTILTDANISTMHVVPARPLSPATTTSEGRVIVVSNNGAVDYQAYLFRWKTVGASQVLDSTTTFDQDSQPVSSSTRIAATAPTAITFGNIGATAGENTNAMMGVLRLRADGEVEFNFLNTEVESINSTTNSPTGEFRAPLVK